MAQQLVAQLPSLEKLLDILVTGCRIEKAFLLTNDYSLLTTYYLLLTTYYLLLTTYCRIEKAFPLDA